MCTLAGQIICSSASPFKPNILNIWKPDTTSNVKSHGLLHSDYPDSHAPSTCIGPGEARPHSQEPEPDSPVSRVPTQTRSNSVPSRTHFLADNSRCNLPRRTRTCTRRQARWEHSAPPLPECGTCRPNVSRRSNCRRTVG
jgi:hypothetical protein